MKKVNLFKNSKYFLYVLLLVCFLTSCGKDQIYKYEIEIACEICKEHNGLLYMHYDVWEWIIKCADGHAERINLNK
jgi:hypothetical protein